MFSIISGILGFATSGLPSLLGFFQQKGDQAHEREMAKLQNEQAMRMAEKGFVSQEKIAAIELEGTFIWAVKSTGGFTPESMDAIFSSDEMSIVASIIGFYFGSRTWEKKRESI